MKTEKRKRLEAKGWRVGSSEEFLGLTPREATIIDMKLTLADCLRESRRKQNLTQTELAQRIGSSQSRVAKMEAGERAISFDMFFHALLNVGTTPQKIGKLFSNVHVRTVSMKKKGTSSARHRLLISKQFSRKGPASVLTHRHR